MADNPPRDQDLSRLAALDDPLRRRLYDLVAAASEPLGRDEAARRLGIGRSLAAYHLDRLVDHGLLTASYERPAGRGGPGAGRPAKRYARAEGEIGVTVPAREYEFAAHLLAEAAESDESGGARDALERVARGAGRAAGEAGAGSLEEALGAGGYEPVADPDGVLRARNCPFHRLATEHRDLVCAMNVAYVDGLMHGLGDTAREVRLDPRPGRCCIAIAPR